MAVTTFIAYVILTALTVFFLREHIKFKVPYGFIGKSVWASLIMALILYWVNPAGVVYVGVMILVGAWI